jgi:hypothetical protein
MHGAPPLVYFTLGALYNKIENHEAAVNHLSYVVENDNADEGTYLHPSNDLRDYVRVLRNIESEATKAPLTSAAVRSLERTRKNRGKIILEDSRRKLEEFKAVNGNTDHKKLSQKSQANGEQTETEKLFRSVVDTTAEKEERQSQNSKQSVRRKLTRRNKNNEEDLFANRKPITEVLHDIYDKNIQ